MTRIIGGSAGGRRIAAPRGAATRPTSDRVREALFSAIEAWCGSLSGLRFLDLYAGSGAVGLEAWSRGAGVVSLVEQDRRTATAHRVQRQVAGLPQGRRPRRLGHARRSAGTRRRRTTWRTSTRRTRSRRRRSSPTSRRCCATAGWCRARWWWWSAPARGGPGVAGRLHRRARTAATATTALWFGPAAGTPTSPRPDRAELTEESSDAPSGLPGDLRPGDQRARRHRRRGPRGSSTRSWWRSASTRPRTGCSPPRSASRCWSGPPRHLDNVRVDGFTGLLTTYCVDPTSSAIVKGLRGRAATSTTSCRWPR